MSLALSEIELLRSITLESFRDFVREFWDEVVPERLVWNWHMDVICIELQRVAERVFKGMPKEHDLIINVPPGTTKSSIASVMFPAWTQARMPSARTICGSHAASLALDLSRKSRDVMQCDKYKMLYPRIELRNDQNTKCLAVGTRILLANGWLRKIEELVPGEKVLSSDGENLTVDEVVSVVPTGVKPVYYIQLCDGTELEATGNHRLCKKDGWEIVKELRVGDYLKVARRIPSQDGKLSKDDAFLLALWLAEGGKNCSTFRVTNTDPLIQQKLQGIAEERGWTTRIKDGKEIFVLYGSKQNDPKSPTAFLRKHGLFRKVTTDTIRIPRAVFCASDEVVWEFIGTYVACDGCVALQAKTIRIVTISRQMAEDLRLLLKRFGVQSCVKGAQAGYRLPNGVYRETSIAYSVDIRRKHSVIALEGLDVYAKKEKLTMLVAEKRKNYDAPNLRGNRDALLEVTEDIEVRRIVSISKLSRVQTFDIETKKFHAFFAEGVLSHNSHQVNNHGGGRYSCGIGGSVIGHHAHFIIIDDPLDPQEALSEAELKTCHEWMDTTLPTRKVDKAVTPTILIMQRLHQNDPTGHMLEKKAGPIKHICLPGDCHEYDVKPKHLRRFYKNGLLDPLRIPRRVLDEAYKTLGAYGYAGQYGQQPAPPGGGIIKPGRMAVEKSCPSPVRFVKMCRYWDKASTPGGGKFTVGALLGWDVDKKFWIIHVRRGQWGPDERERIIEQTCKEDAELFGRFLVQFGFEEEPGSSGKVDFMHTKRNLAGFRVKADKVTGNKETRAMPMADEINSHNFSMVFGDWNRDLVDEMLVWPKGTYVDQVDACAGAYNMLTGSSTRVGAL